MGTAEKVIATALVGGFFVILLYLYDSVILAPRRLRSKLERQGVRGPSPSVLLGNVSQMKEILNRARSSAAQNDKLHDVVSVGHGWPSLVFSHLLQWRNEYGPTFTYAMGTLQFLYSVDIEFVKEISIFTSLSLGRPLYLSKEHGPLLGRGIISSSGSIWAHQKKIIAPALYLDKVKGMVSLMVESTISMIRSWETKIESVEGGVADIKIDDEFRSLSGDIISRACFGSSYSQGQHIFAKLRTLQKLMSKIIIGIPGSRFIPTKNNINIWRLEKQIEEMILTVVKKRTEAGDEKDLLQMILEGAEVYGGVDSPSLGITRDKFIVDNCKNIYFAGHETTATTASWVLVLLAAYPLWQDRVREEVERVCKDCGVPDIDTLRGMKILTMVIQETLRLYSPGVFISRKALEDIQLKDIRVPKGTHIQIPISILHQDPGLWGPDAHEFKPERFENGILGACKIPQAYVPFGLGPRICVGQHLANVELKVILSLVLSKFRFSLSPTYRHSAAYRLVIEPEYGVNLLVERI